MKSPSPQLLNEEEWVRFCAFHVRELTVDEIVASRDILHSAETLALKYIDSYPEVLPPVQYPEVRLNVAARCEGVDLTEVGLVRDLYAQGMPPEEISVEMNLEYSKVESILDGEVAPCAKGVLRPIQHRGLHQSAVYRPEQRRFQLGVFNKAVSVLLPDEFEVVCNQNGVDPNAALTVISNLEVTDARIQRLEYRHFLRAQTS